MRNLLLALMLVVAAVVPVSAQDDSMTLTVLGTYATGVFDGGAAEIVAHDPTTQTLWVVNGDSDMIDLLDISDPANPTLSASVDYSDYGDAANSVAISGETVAIAIQAEETDGAGSIAFYNTAGEFLSVVEAGVLPDMVTFSPDGTKVLSANEGEPSDDYLTDPEGSVTIVDISGGAANVTQDNVMQVTFEAFNEGGDRASELSADVRVYGPEATAAQDLEPEYIAVSPDNTTAFVTLQENNALAVIDITAGTVSAIVPLGFKDHMLPGNELDVSNEDGAINIQNWPLLGMYQPDAIAAYEVDGTLYLVTANEGDARDYEGYSEEGEVSEMTLDAEAFPNAAEIQAVEQVGKAEVTLANGDTDGDGDYDALYIPGARSFTIWDAATGAIVFDSGSDFERITAEAYPDDFNSDNAENGVFDDRSDNKGPEPEGVALGTIGDQTYAFIGLETIGGVIVYNITDPAAPAYVTYVNNRDFSGDPEAGTALDLGPEGIIFISAENSPTGSPLVVTANEVSGTTTILEVGM